MTDTFTKADLRTYIDSVALAQGLVNPNTASGWKAALSRIFENVHESADVRSVDIKTEVRKYNNSHPGVLSPASLQQYEMRLVTAINQFIEYKNDPTKYKGHGRLPGDGAQKNLGKKKSNAANKVIAASGSALPPVAHIPPTPISGLSFVFPMRPDFLAQIVIPRDMNEVEARRLMNFILTLAHDVKV